MTHLRAIFAPQLSHAYTESIRHQTEANVDYSQIISIDPAKRSGKPCVRGTRITVCDILGYMAAGMSDQEILADFPSLTETDLLACLAFAAEPRFDPIRT